MSESSQMFMMFCLTIIAVIGIISAVICYSKGQIKFNMKARAKLPNNTDTEFGINVDKKENR